MPTEVFKIPNEWTQVASTSGQLVVTSYIDKAKLVVTSGAAPDFNHNVAGHILPTRENITLLLSAGEVAWVHGDGYVTVTAGG